MDLDAEFGSKKKKKSSKKKKAIEAEDGIDDAADADADEGRDGTHTGSGTSWDGTTRDYHYDELLGRVFGILREKNPALGEKAKTIIKPPQVLREGTKKTVFANLMEICNAISTERTRHAVLVGRVGTSGTLDGQQRLVLGEILAKGIRGCVTALLHRLRHLQHVQIVRYAVGEGASLACRIADAACGRLDPSAPFSEVSPL